MSAKERVVIPLHTHCRVCGKSIPWGKDYCSNECREKEMKAQRRAKRMSRLYLLFFVVVFILLMVVYLLSPSR
jgi:predicted nucleic acid-binding Zn ribbon protein